MANFLELDYNSKHLADSDSPSLMPQRVLHGHHLLDTSSTSSYDLGYQLDGYLLSYWRLLCTVDNILDNLLQ